MFKVIENGFCKTVKTWEEVLSILYKFGCEWKEGNTITVKNEKNETIYEET